jgi:hypothetical protein
VRTPVTCFCSVQDYRDLKEVRYESVDWIHVAQDRVQWLSVLNTAMNLLVQHKKRNFLTS